MRRPWHIVLALATGLAGLAGPGCAVGPTLGPVCVQNPTLVPTANGQFVFEQIVDVVDDYFTIDREEPVRQIGNVMIEGRIETLPQVGATLLEPWRGDSADGYEKLESTLQSIRRRATVRVIPTGGGYLVEADVLKDLEDVPKPEFATAGAATFRQDGSLERYTDPVAGQQPTIGWIPTGRDAALEQRILSDIQAHVAEPPQTLFARSGRQLAF